VTAATTTGSGPSGSECRKSCILSGAMPDQGYGCNINDPNGGVADCPSGATQCNQVSNSPASLGICFPTPSDAGTGSKDAGTGPKDASTKG
jgi:hypothetical protein